MTIELWMLFWVVVLAFVQMMIAVQGATFQFGVVALAGNREGLETLSGWKGRAERAYRNPLEFLPHFAGLVLIGHVAGISSGLGALGAQLFSMRESPTRSPISLVYPG